MRDMSPLCELQFYFGRTSNAIHTRFNGHRSCFKLSSFEYEKSALSDHVFKEHIENFGDKLIGNFNAGIVGNAPPRNLERLEDFYIYESKADMMSLNRYRAVE